MKCISSKECQVDDTSTLFIFLFTGTIELLTCTIAPLPFYLRSRIQTRLKSINSRVLIIRVHWKCSVQISIQDEKGVRKSNSLQYRIKIFFNKKIKIKFLLLHLYVCSVCNAMLSNERIISMEYFGYLRILIRLFE